ncbi:2Fe-2S iron-sulfur cluster-binding protein [Sphingobium chungbukense]|uniref:Ferredoxin n=1 Tax=Sphingobium chungbukense TaxID=56193 RepID=A0A0M3ANM7_9SPHN|nr:2Fe-2S iron-sulfur cluster-binding protein [Sphingobium chungbukense]KKW90144.1 ferredoxin [Sphingobium chungbukense]
MAKISITGTAGETRIIEPQSGLTVMEIIRDAGFDEMIALCGGNCSCATCHVYVDGEVDVGPPGDDEDDLLSSSDKRRDRSRLSCQIIFDETMVGLSVTIANEES